MDPGGLAVFKTLVGVAIPLAAFATGLETSRRVKLRWLWHQPALLLRSLLAVVVLVPLWALLVLAVSKQPGMVENGLLISVFAMGMGPPATLQRARKPEQEVAYTLGLNITLLALAIGVLPAAIALHGALVGGTLSLAPEKVAALVLSRVFIPLAAGLCLARFVPKVAARIAHFAGSFVTGVMLAAAVLVLFLAWRPLLALGARAWLTSVAIVLPAVAVGYLLGGPHRETRSVLAAFTALRFPALAFLILAQTAYGRSATPVVLMYVLTSLAVVGLTEALRKAWTKRHRLPPREVQHGEEAEAF
ncbi:hypothetical protein [Corallococcus terminator]|uniref:Symporter n=1 Tax=Corallococcus terminator TaxID=2316733 RepID=A0A3A8J7X1_9BACT|nr:hypothetical protein [Corallococcus terminator]RKG91595.1 hypothetical protein D7V88_09125 [Corallococcus terminator]